MSPIMAQYRLSALTSSGLFADKTKIILLAIAHKEFQLLPSIKRH